MCHLSMDFCKGMPLFYYFSTIFFQNILCHYEYVTILEINVYLIHENNNNGVYK